MSCNLFLLQGNEKQIKKINKTKIDIFSIFKKEVVVEMISVINYTLNGIINHERTELL